MCYQWAFSCAAGNLNTSLHACSASTLSTGTSQCMLTYFIIFSGITSALHCSMIKVLPISLWDPEMTSVHLFLLLFRSEYLLMGTLFKFQSNDSFKICQKDTLKLRFILSFPFKIQSITSCKFFCRLNNKNNYFTFLIYTSPGFEWQSKKELKSIDFQSIYAYVELSFREIFCY